MSHRSRYRAGKVAYLEDLAEQLKKHAEVADQLFLADLADSLEQASRHAADGAEDIREETNVAE